MTGSAVAFILTCRSRKSTGVDDKINVLAAVQGPGIRHTGSLS